MVAIKDMKMPECCSKCQLYHYYIDYNGIAHTICKYENAEILINDEKRNDICPLTEVLEHEPCEEQAHCEEQVIKGFTQMMKGLWGNDSLEEPNIVNASDIKQDDEWMQENEWDEVYKKETHENTRKHTETHECDCIDRQAVLDLLQMRYFGKDLYKAIYELPPVYPARPTCENAISRQDAIRAVKHAWAKGLEPTQFLEELPSVYPARPKGKWIKAGTCGDAYNVYYLYKCSNCGKLKEEPTSDFCPNCGSRMRGDDNV